MSTQTVVRIRRSTVTNAPTYLAAGELAYSSLSEYLFLGMGSESGSYPNQDASDHLLIGGTKFTKLLGVASDGVTFNDISGTATASKAVILDGSKKINEWFVDNLKLDGNTISATNTNGTIYLLPDGTGTIDVSGFRVTSGADPVGATDLTTKQYVDSVAIGIRDFKDSVRLATTANIVSLSGTMTIDGVSAIAGDRILVKNQSTGSQNGIYVVAAGAWSRAADADTSAEVTSGMYVMVEEGGTYAGAGFVLATANPITLGTTSLTFTQFNGAGAISGTADRITVSSGVIDIAATYVGQSSITTLGTIATGVWQGTAVTTPYGGTGLTSYTAGDIVYYASGTALTKLGIGSVPYKVLRVNAATNAPEWADVDGGTF